MSRFRQFWPHYLSLHLDKFNRSLHLVGTTAVVLAVIGILLFGRPVYLLLVPLLGYGPAWAGHFLFERNKPAAFGNPFLSLMADFYMWGLFLTGRLNKEIEALKKSQVPGQSI